MTDKTHKKEVRRQRRQEEKTKRARDTRRQTIMVWGGLGVIVLLVGYVVFQAINPASKPGTPVANLGNQHVNSPSDPHVPYNSVPPTSGPHMPSLAPWGISKEPIVNEYQIHNLEDAGVLIQYDCPEDCPELKARLTDFANQLLSDTSLVNPQTGKTHILLAPYPGIRSAQDSGGKPIALTAWTRIQYFDDVDPEKMMAFIRAFINIDHHVGGQG